MNIEMTTLGLGQAASILGLTERGLRDRVEAGAIRTVPGMQHLRFRLLDLVGQHRKVEFTMADAKKFARKNY